MPDKECFKCKESKPLTEFYKHSGMTDGRLGKCKECNKSDVRANRKDKISYYQQYDKDRAMNPDRVAMRKAYVKTDNGKASIAKACVKYRENNPVKYKAQTMVGNAIRDKKLFSEPCEECGATRTHGHHDDYKKPLNVRWLCPAHHSIWHSINGEGLT